MEKILNPLDHITIIPSDYRKSVAFYEVALAPLGITRISNHEHACGFGVDKPFFWLGEVGDGYEQSKSLHIAFSASSKNEVSEFHKAALIAGGLDNGAPEYQQYHSGYYGAFVFDPDGNNVEAVYRENKI